MAYQTLAENIVSALILAVHGDLTMSVSESIDHVEVLLSAFLATQYVVFISPIQESVYPNLEERIVS